MPDRQTTKGSAASARDIATIRQRLGERSIVLVGMMGAGKSSIGRRLAEQLSLPFVDADAEIESAAGKTITEIFEEHGEAYFREGERRVIGRLLGRGRQILSTGGGAFMSKEIREMIAAKGISIWLKADLDILMQRVRKRSTRPLLKTADPEAVMRQLMEVRYPVYAAADITVQSREVPHEVIIGEILRSLASSSVLGQSGEDTSGAGAS